MRIPHHLVRAPSGLWSYRQRVPVDVQPIVGRQTFKRTLHTYDMREARLRALTLAARYAQVFSVLRERRMQSRDDDLDALLARLTATERPQELTLNRTRSADGSITEQWQIDTPEDVTLYQQLMALTAPQPSALGELIHQHVPSLPAPRRTTKPAIETITLGKARDAWLDSIKASTLPKTWTIKRTAIDLLTRFLGEKTKLPTITRSDLARWYQHMRDNKASTPTLTNKQSYIGGKGGFFEWAQASGHYPRGDNPASGHVSYSTREKRARRKFGFKAYDAHQVQALFAPAAFEALPLAARWASLIGLYTGARASEVGQLLTADVVEDSGIPCIQVSDEGEHQKVKTDVSLRTVPVHPDLLALGFLDWVEQARDEGQERLFPAAKADAKNGQGNWISKAFSRHLAEVGKNWPKAKRGFHSLRKTLIQELQGAGVVSELRAQLVGHELDDEHHVTYSRAFTAREKLDGLQGVSPGLSVLAYGISLNALLPLLKEPPPSKKPSKPRKQVP
ncbi:site-specific integrase [Xanthomonas graminis]|jgi:integrase|uniref:site-specific integrase n=1 Tax=Xanthomonas graminis TaxID=3390026 RepID=UPI0005868EEF|nr:site-specific integrase [Xanthomonas translucens]OAX58729.1 integrase [Xanthomonas translucens pv. graminis]UKE55296.1 site-specific integrase [Xanthomonas translucens pv. graminis]WIH11601.1 site-specific integrase [Xanthomonas translucens pv. graminis]WIH15241.1 site-specific integrase [Xanthomonas translucens pv. graminis]